uniref:MADS-box domain-containing protein n=1 Tax=Leersia perrieri TaxID=77586 RepID=A0A0D9UZV4_9ORYZ
MARNKIVLKRIAKNSTRRLTFKKRRSGLIKKARELASLCGIGVCVAVYGESEVKPEVCPSVPEVRTILSRFTTAPDVDRFKRVMNQEEFLQNRITMIQERMSKEDDETRERDATVMLYEAATGKRPVADLNVGELTNLGLVIDERIKNLKEHIKRLGGEAPMEPSSLPTVPPYANVTGMERNKRMKKIVLDRIANDATRRATFKKRRRGLMKKASELSTLCDVEACLVVFGEGEVEPEAWPSQEDARSVLDRFRALPETEQSKKMMNQEDFLRQRIAKLQDQVAKAVRENRERENKLLLHDALAGKLGGYESLTVEQLTSLDCAVNDKLRAVTARLAEMRAQNQVIPLPALPAPPSMPMPPPMPIQMTMMPPTSSLMTPVAPLPYTNPVELSPMGPPPGFEGIGQIHIQNQNQVQIQIQNQNQNHEPDWLIDVARNGGDLGALVYSGYTGGNSNGASASNSNGASTSSGAGAGWPDMPDIYNPGMLGGYCPWDDSAGPSFPPM